MGCAASVPAANGGIPHRRGWTGNRRAPSRIRASASSAGSPTTGGGAPAASASSMGILVTTPTAAARHSQQAYEGLRIEAGMAATPVGPAAEEFKFFCPLCMCAGEIVICPGIALRASYADLLGLWWLPHAGSLTRSTSPLKERQGCSTAACWRCGRCHMAILYGYCTQDVLPRHGDAGDALLPAAPLLLLPLRVRPLQADQAVGGGGRRGRRVAESRGGDAAMRPRAAAPGHGVPHYSLLTTCYLLCILLTTY